MSDSFLIQLTVALIKKGRLFLTVLFFLLALGCFYQLMVSSKYEFVTVVELAKSGDGTLLEARGRVATIFEHQWVYQTERDFFEEYGHSPVFEVDTQGPEGGLLLFSSVGESKLGEEIRWFHSSLAQELVESQSVSEQLARTRLEAQIDVAERGLHAYQKNNTPGLSDTDLFEALVSLKGRLIGMQPAKIRVVAQQKEEALGLGLGLRLLLTVIQAFVLAVLFVLFYYFIRRVNRAIQVDKERL